MSRVGKLPVKIAQGVTIDVSGQQVTVKGKNGELKISVPQEIAIKKDASVIEFKPASASKQARALWGTVRNTVNNMVTGVSQGFKMNLEMTGVGYRAAVDKGILSLFLGYSHEIKYAPPKGVTLKCEKPTNIEITGADKRLVGQVAAEIRSLRPPEPYKGKGIRRDSEKVRRKEGKKK